MSAPNRSHNLPEEINLANRVNIELKTHFSDHLHLVYMLLIPHCISY